MEENKDYLEETPEQTEELDNVMSIFIAVMSESNEKIDPKNIPFDGSIRELFDDDVRKFGIALAQLHTYLDIVPTYKMFTEFEEFATLNDVFQYLGEKVLTMKNLW